MGLYQSEAIGVVTQVWRYPVKSMQGETLTPAAITERGIVGDRAYTLLDRTSGGIASAKNPRKWGALAQCRAVFVEPPQAKQPLPPVWITLPDGSMISSADPQVDQALSHVLGRDVTLVSASEQPLMRETDRTPLDAAEHVITQEPIGLAAPQGTFFDVAALHLLTTTTLQRLREIYPAGDFAVARFRPNLVIAPPSTVDALDENNWISQTLRVGACELDIIDPCPRCVVTTLARGDLPHDPNILRTVARHTSATGATLAPGVVFPGVVGVYARFVNGAAISAGDYVHHADSRA
jgi:hypothetical protein